MAIVSEVIPESLQPEVDAAQAWFNFAALTRTRFAHADSDSPARPAATTRAALSRTLMRIWA